jgi:hypothetical protein
MDMNELEMPSPESSEIDLGLEEMELPGEEEDKEVADMISKLEELGYRVEKIEDEMPEPEEGSDDMEIGDLDI